MAIPLIIGAAGKLILGKVVQTAVAKAVQKVGDDRSVPEMKKTDVAPVATAVIEELHSNIICRFEGGVIRYLVRIVCYFARVCVICQLGGDVVVEFGESLILVNLQENPLIRCLALDDPGTRVLVRKISPVAEPGVAYVSVEIVRP